MLCALELLFFFFFFAWWFISVGMRISFSCFMVVIYVADGR